MILEQLPPFVFDRYYDPELGRFISPDPLLDSINRYTYCHNNPVIYTDPSGNFASWFWGLIFLPAVTGYMSGFESSGSWDPTTWDSSNWQAAWQRTVFYASLSYESPLTVLRNGGVGGDLNDPEERKSIAVEELYYPNDYGPPITVFPESVIEYIDWILKQTTWFPFVSGYNEFKSPFGEREHPMTHKWDYHSGIDVWSSNLKLFGGISGSTTTGYNNPERGNYVFIRKGNIQIEYWHLKSIAVQNNIWVQGGTFLGTMGQTGKATGVRVHFVIKVFNSTSLYGFYYINPILVYPQYRRRN